MSHDLFLASPFAENGGEEKITVRPFLYLRSRCTGVLVVAKRAKSGA
jgi:hypothetical protein